MVIKPKPSFSVFLDYLEYETKSSHAVSRGFKATYRRRVRQTKKLSLVSEPRSNQNQEPGVARTKSQKQREPSVRNCQSHKVISLSTEPNQSDPYRVFCFIFRLSHIWDKEVFAVFLEVKVENPRYKAAVFSVRSIAVIDSKGRLHISQNAEFFSCHLITFQEKNVQSIFSRSAKSQKKSSNYFHLFTCRDYFSSDYAHTLSWKRSSVRCELSGGVGYNPHLPIASLLTIFPVLLFVRISSQ